MKIIPLWKLRRELFRAIRQMRAAPRIFLGYLFATRYYDLFLAGKITRTPGHVPACSKVAIYLIYPEHGLQSSHRRGLEYLLSKGYAPIVVSNLPLRDVDRAQLLPLCHICVERPNFGYDFGGYRDGILTIMADMPKLDRLLLINDSTWFALPGRSDWIEESEAMGVDMAAAASNYGIPRVDAGDYRKIRWHYVKTHKNFHFCSFALLFSHRVLEDPNFARFWRKFRLSSDKKRTVRRGEIGLSQWVLSRGFTDGVSCNLVMLEKDIEELDDMRLRELAGNMIVLEDQRMLAVKREVLASNPSRNDLICLVLTCVARQGSSYALADFAINELGFPFLKKSPVWLSKEASDITLRLAGSLPGPYGEEIHAEALKLRGAKARFD